MNGCWGLIRNDSIFGINFAVTFSRAGTRRSLLKGAGTVICAPHLNPARAGIVEASALLESFRWSRHGHYLKMRGERPFWLRADRLLGVHGITKDSESGHQEFGIRMERRRGEEPGTDYRELRKDWCLGSEEFRKDLLVLAGASAGPNHYGSERKERSEEKARRIIGAEMKRLGWDLTELERRRKGDPGKVAIARRLRGETTVSLKWVAENVAMGTWTTVANLLSATNKRSRPL